MCMKEAVSRISTYSADTFGVCSSLYELGGMVVIHDPSGCNSTYATHDEPRWYDQDSLIFISGVTEMDAIMGNDDKFVHDVVLAAHDFSPRFIVILCTPVLLMTGADMDALAAMIEEQTGILTMAATTNNMNLYDKGIAWAMKMLAERIVKDVPAPRSAGPMCCSWQPEFAACGAGLSAKPLRVNVIGATPLDFSYNGSEKSMKRFLRRSGFSPCSVWAMGSPLEEIEMAGLADVNLVVSAGAVEGAKVMKKRFGIPYVVGVPIGPYMQEEIARGLRRAADTKEDIYVCADSRADCGEADTIIIGESVYSASLAAALGREGRAAKVYCLLNEWPGVLGKEDVFVSSEGELRRRLADWTGTVIADPLYGPVVPEKAHFVGLGHTAFSGRLYQKVIPNLIDDFESFVKKVNDFAALVHTV